MPSRPRDHDGFEAYVAERRRALLRFATVLSGDPVLADDVVAQVLSVAYERWPRVSAADNVHAYVRRMVLNEYLGWRRRAARMALRDDVGDLLAPVADHADAHADQQHLVHELRRLPDKQRAAVVLRFYEQLTYPEIAALLGTSEVGVRSNVSRALATLRIQLVDEPPSPPDPAATTFRPPTRPQEAHS